MPAAGKLVRDLGLPPQARVISRMCNGQAKVVGGDTLINAGDRVLVVLEPDVEEFTIKLLCAQEPIKKRRKKRRGKKKSKMP